MLQLAGSIALVLVALFAFATSWIGHYAAYYGLGDPNRILNSLHTPFVQVPMNILGFAALLFPIGFVVHAVRKSRKPELTRHCSRLRTVLLAK